jgi:hypothetical protein
MKKITFLGILTLVTLIWACGNSLKDDPKVKEAGKIHLEASEIQEAKQADEVIAALSKVKTDFEDWEANVFEVPGVEHDHEHAEGEHHHHHDHKPAPDLTPDQMLDVQKEMLKTIQGLKETLNQNMDKAKALLQ